MVKSKSAGLSKLPPGQRNHFVIGPVSSWFMPNISDLWTRPEKVTTLSTLDSSESSISHESLVINEEEPECPESYYIYGSIGCFCYGPIRKNMSAQIVQYESAVVGFKRTVSSSIENLIDIKEDNSRVNCVRFLKTHHEPFAMVLTENGTLVIHDCVHIENLIHFKKNELLDKFEINNRPSMSENLSSTENLAPSSKKRPKMTNMSQQVNSFVWPQPKNAFLAVSLLKDRENLLIWLKMKDITRARRKNGHLSISKTDLIIDHEIITLDTGSATNFICCMECTMTEVESNCLIAIGMDDGLIMIQGINLTTQKVAPLIKLARHNDQICSLALYTLETKFASGILASVSRDGLVLVWDIENELYFADYQARGANDDNHRNPNKRINWFSLDFVSIKLPSEGDDKHIMQLALSNCDSGITLLDIPDRIRSKVRLKDSRSNSKSDGKCCCDQRPTGHHALIFNLVYDPLSQIIATCSLDGNHILWTCKKQNGDSNNKQYNNNNKKNHKNSSNPIVIECESLISSMPNNARTHMLRFSPIRHDLLGIAMGDAGLRFHTISTSNMQRSFHMTTSQNTISRMVTKLDLSPTSLAWSPTQEYKLAIGTIEGKVLLANLMPRRATLIVSKRAIEQPIEQTSHDDDSDIFDVEYQPMERESENEQEEAAIEEPDNSKENKTDAIYSISWGPNPRNPTNFMEEAIYTVGSISHRLFIHYATKNGQDETLRDYLSEPNAKKTITTLPECQNEASEVCWKSDKSLMALGTIPGKIIISRYRQDPDLEDTQGCEVHCRQQVSRFDRLIVIEGMFGSTFIQCLAWHPSSDRDDPYYNLLAASSNESPAFVFNLKRGLNLVSMDALGREVPVHLTDHLYKLDGHKKALTDIAWSPDEQEVLATASFDRTCLVWSLGLDGKAPPEVPNGQALDSSIKVRSKFSARERLFTLEWSPYNGVILTSGHDPTLWAWRPSDNKYVDPGSWE